MRTALRKFIVLMFVCAPLAGLCQKIKEVDVPIAVTNAFRKLFADASAVSWSREGSTEFEAEFKSKGLKKSVNFDASGKWLNTETEMEASDLPAKVKSAVAKEFAGCKVTEAELFESPGKAAGYELGLKNKYSKFEVIIAADGTIVSKKGKK